MHHRTKRDAPSGTAKTLAEILSDVRKHHSTRGPLWPLRDCWRTHRGGNRDAFASRWRVVGDHTVIFAGAGERIELTHKASSRETFANGALRAAEWVVKQKPGLYDMQDVLG